MVEQVSVFLENEPGHLAELTRALAAAGINMRALVVADTAEFGVVRIICDRPRAAKEALEASGFGVTLTRVLAVQMPDRPGGLAQVVGVLSDAGVNIEYMYAFVEPGADAAVDIVRVDDPKRAAEALEDAGVRCLRAEDLYATEDAGSS
ncbi:MAG: ACT domain-containing protein [Coriobacteriia bacterium]|nr:ACT domain-containing protein [Coriobacteriia bacterium]